MVQKDSYQDWKKTAISIMLCLIEVKELEYKTAFNKSQYYERIIRTIRWIAIAIAIATIPINSYRLPQVYSIVLLAIIYNLLRHFPKIMTTKFFSSHIVNLVIDNILIMLLLMLTGGINSPFYVYFALTFFSAAYWYGTVGIITTSVFQIFTSAIISLNINPVVSTMNLYPTIIVESVALISIGFLVKSLTKIEEREKDLIISANRQIEMERQRLSALINSMANAVLVVDWRGKITLYNGAALELLDTNEQLLQKSISKLIPLRNTTNKKIQFFDLLDQTSGIIKRNDLIYFNKEGQKINLDISIAPIQISYGSKQSEAGYILILRDITKEKTLDEQKDEFISVTSHELRTPIAVAEASISTALLPNYAKMDSKATTLLEQAHKNIIFLADLVNDLSTLAKAERKDLPVELSLVDANAMVEQLGKDYQTEAASKNLYLRTVTSNSIKPLISSESIIHEILQNFITNSIKYTEKGGITIEANQAEDDKGIVFHVKDTGIGMSISDQKKIFSKFYRSEDFRTRKTKGTGLGLYITMRLAERIGAKIEFKSKLNQGSVFSLEVHRYKKIKDEI